MAPRTGSDEVLTVGVDLDAKNALRAMQKFQRAMKTEMQNVTKTVKNLDKINKKHLKDAVEGSKEWLDELDDLAYAHDEEAQRLDKIGGLLDDLRKKQKKLTGEAKKGIEDQIELLEKQAGTLSSQVTAKLVGRVASNKLRANIREGLEKGIEEATPIFQSFFGKDLKGLIESGSKGAGKLLGFGLTKGAAAAFKGGAALKGRGDAMKDAGAARGGMGGAAMGAMGGALKGLGGIVGKFGPILQMVGKLGPLLSTISTVLLAVVKLLIDAEAGAKQFQKDLLATASTTEFLATAGGDSAAAFTELEETVKGVRDAAYGFDNIKWGISPDEFKAAVGALNQEGVSLRELRNEADKAGKSMQDFTGELVHSSVAYSRAFGVPLQEISQMQSELFTDMGKNLQESRLSFAQMTMAASESGIASNKFFAMIRGVSSDLSLYNTRLEDAVKTLKLLGKVMSPKNAQKFMQTAMQALKGMGRTDLLKTALLGGGGTQKALQRDLDRKAKNIGDDINKASGKAFSKEDLLTKPVDELLDGIGDEQKGALREAISDLKMDTKASKKGVFGQAMAMHNAGPAASLEMMKNSLNIGGTGKLADRIGDLGTQMMAENQGISQDQLAGMAKFEMAIDDEKDSLKKGLEKNDPATLEKLAKAGIAATKEGIDAAATDQIYDTMDKSQQELAKVDAGIQDTGQAQAKLTSSILDKIGQLVDFIMNQIYDVMLQIYESVNGLFAHFGGKKGPSADDLRNARSLAKSTGITELGKTSKEGLQGSNIAKAMNKAADRYDAINDELSKLGDDYQEQQRKLGLGTAQGVGLKNIGKVTENQQAYEKRKKELKDEQSGIAGAAKEYAKNLSFSDEQIKNNPKYETVGAMMSGDNMSDSDIVQLMRRSTTDKNEFGGTLNETSSAYGVAAEQMSKLGFYDKGKGEALDPKLASSAAEASVKTGDATQATADKLNEKHSIVVKFSDQFLNTKYKKTVEGAVLDAARTALFEFYLYSKLEPKDVLKYMKQNNMTAEDFAKEYTKQSVDSGEPMKLDDVTASGNATGGFITGVDGGLATVRAAAGEGLASVGRGERILPAGAGGGGGSITIPVSVNGVGADDLAKIIHAKVVDGIAEYKRRERFN